MKRTIEQCVGGWGGSGPACSSTVAILVKSNSARNFERVEIIMPTPVKWVTKPTTPAQKAKTVVASGAAVLTTTRRRGPSRPSSAV